MIRALSRREGVRPIDAGIQNEILALNLRRITRLALILVPVHVAHVILFWRHGATPDPQAEAWRRGIMIAHALMLPVAAGFFALCIAAGRGRLPQRLRKLLPILGALTYLLFGAALAVLDQKVTPSITPVLVAAVGVAGTILMPPLTAAFAYATLLLAFWTLIAWTQPDPEIVLSLRVNSLTMSGIGFGIAYLFWQNQVLTLRQRREIEAHKLALEEKNEELARLVVRDPLTGVSNRSHLDAVAAAEVARLRRTGRTSSLVLLDIDRFKEINDRYGHPAGDAVLRQVAKVLSGAVREIDTLARMGGEEFAILLPDTPPREAAAVAERLRALIEAHPFTTSGVTIRLTASFGVAPFTVTDETDALTAAYRAADRELYRAKEQGRNRVCMAETTPASG